MLMPLLLPLDLLLLMLSAVAKEEGWLAADGSGRGKGPVRVERDMRPAFVDTQQ